MPTAPKKSPRTPGRLADNEMNSPTPGAFALQRKWQAVLRMSTDRSKKLLEVHQRLLEVRWCPDWSLSRNLCHACHFLLHLSLVCRIEDARMLQLSENSQWAVKMPWNRSNAVTFVKTQHYGNAAVRFRYLSFFIYVLAIPVVTYMQMFLKKITVTGTVATSFSASPCGWLWRQQIRHAIKNSCSAAKLVLIGSVRIGFNQLEYPSQTNFRHPVNVAANRKATTWSLFTKQRPVFIWHR